MWVSVALVAGCATTQQTERVAKIDPFESINRAVFTFNENADEYVIKPAAEAYQFVLPEFVRTGVTNFFSNIGDIFVAVNNLLQGKPGNAANDIGRFLVNSTIGILGLFDVATEAGLEKNKEDFGQTLGVWGVPSGPYVVLPLFGPSSIRDTAGLVVDIKTDFILNSNQLNHDQKVGSTVLRVVNQRANLLNASQLLEDAAFDKYSFLRDSYLQRRFNQVHDGNPPLSAD
ncbi:phospholipid-binding lipoprotein MlaA [Polynucleobacter victoriensis]|uniref:Phospholipid-binding lipoprotein MlaA n=2 Tax=Polynucleobacter victoriensis TaxID=2049319 RepID=A0A212TAX1_9BURK|nr:phospholipid-binding lipoprotein MlaA [Polynucleobacter victoriensis]